MVGHVLVFSVALSAPFFALVSAGADTSSLIAEHPTTFCNPLDLDYCMLQDPQKGFYREAADPVALVYKGAYYIFASQSNGYWTSSDFVNWKLVTPPNLPLDQWAPAVFEYAGALYFMATGDGKIYKSEHPEEASSWSVAGTVRRDQDPDLFADDDGRVYLYYGCHAGGPVSGVELDPKHNFSEIGQPVDLIRAAPKERGWERGGGDSYSTNRAFLEGSWMTKHGGKYYLQYAAPGTQWKTYGDGAYVGDKPLGPLTYAPNSPISFKPTGFLGSAGHSATFATPDGHVWRIVTAVIGVTHGFERRLAIYPQGFDEDGRMFTRTYLGDYPQYLPGKAEHPEQNNSPGWMLLSGGKTVKASSSLVGHPPEAAVDEDIRTWWSSAGNAPGEWLSIDLGGPKTIRAVQINFAEQDVKALNRTPDFAQRYLLEYSLDGKSWTTMADRRESTKDTPHAYLELARPLSARYVRITDAGTPGGGKFSLRGLRVFGTGNGRAPEKASSLSVVRSTTDPREATLSWPAVAGADGYIVRYGVAPDALWNQYEIRGATSLNLKSLNLTPDYWFAIDTFNENGVTPWTGSAIAAPSLKNGSGQTTNLK